MPQAAHRPTYVMWFFFSHPSLNHNHHNSACQLKKAHSKLEPLAVRDTIMARGNQRDKAREKNQKELSAQVSFPRVAQPTTPLNDLPCTSQVDGSTEEEE